MPFSPLFRFSRSIPLFALFFAAVLAGCGGSGGDPGASTGEGGASSAVQQYPAGIWEGTVGSGTSQRTMVGFIEAGEDGKGGDFYLARGAAGAGGYDAIFGLLRTNLTAVVASGVTYFSLQDGKFAPNLTLRGTAAPNPATGKIATINGNYSNPAGTAAATGGSTSFKLNYSKLNDYQASAQLIEGTYRGTGVFGGNWVITVSARGALSGRMGGCTVQGSIAPRSQDSAAYAVTMNLSGDESSCGSRGTQQSGLAVLRFDTSNLPNGIWVFTRNSIGPNNTFVLNGLADPRQPSIPSTTPLSAAGNWAGTLTLPPGVSGDPDIHGMLLPDGGFFFYTNSSFNHNVLHGRFIRYGNDITTNRFVTANDSVFFDRLTVGTAGSKGGYIDGVLVDATLESAGNNAMASRLTGTYNYASQPGGYPTRFTMQPDPLYALPAGKQPNVNAIVGTYRMAGSSFGGHQVDIDIAADGSITGATSNECVIVGKLLGDLGTNHNLYRVEAFGFLNSPTTPDNFIGCELSSGPSQSGSASALFDNQGNVIGLRILTAGLSQGGQRSHTVFVGSKR